MWEVRLPRLKMNRLHSSLDFIISKEYPQSQAPKPTQPQSNKENTHFNLLITILSPS